MTTWGYIGTALALGGLAVLAWHSVRSLLQARVLLAGRRRTLVNLRGRAAALRGDVRVREVIHISYLGDCLWQRQTTYVRGGFWRRRNTWTREDWSETTADFSIVVDGEAVRISGDPTEVNGHASKSVVDNAGFVDGILGEADHKTTDEWLPVTERLTVVGRLEKRGDAWVIGPDSRVGFLFTPDEPMSAALHENVKGWLGLVGVAAGIAAIYWFIGLHGVR